MKLKVADRIRLLSILPEKGNLLTIKIVRELRENLSFSEKEHKDFGLKGLGDRIVWDDDKDKGKKVLIGDQAKEVIEKSLRDLNEKDELTVPDIGLWEKFIGEV